MAGKPKYRVGELVYSYQNKTKAAKIAFVHLAPAFGSKNYLRGYQYSYKLNLSDGYSNWINESSPSKRREK